MAKKLTYDYVKSKFEEEGYTLLSKEYVNSKTKLDYICHNGHRHNVKWNDWQTGYRCPYCAGNAKLTIDFVREQFEKEGYRLLSNGYINKHTKLYYSCPNAHRHYITWGNWKSGWRCPYCSGKAKLTIDFVRKEFEKEGYVLLSNTYANTHTKLKYICPFGHKHSIAWTKWQQGRRCPTCAVISNSAENHYNWKGGKSFEPYCEVWKDIEFKTDIRERDGNKCLNPYCNSKNPTDLTIHHINYNKQDCHPSNLITVCRSCNSAANKDRKWHKAWYQAIMGKRYSL